MHRGTVEIAGKTFQVELREGASAPELYLDGKRVPYDLRRAGPEGAWSLLLDGRSHTVSVEPDGEGLRIEVDGEVLAARVESEGQRLARRLRKASGAGGSRRVLRSPMPGVITKIHVREGQSVARRDPLIAMEAMKMENELVAEAGGTVEKILVAPGAAVAAHQDLIILA